jgi:hypothetical protein
LRYEQISNLFKIWNTNIFLYLNKIRIWTNFDLNKIRIEQI